MPVFIQCSFICLFPAGEILEDLPIACQAEIADGSELLQCRVLITNDETALLQHGKLSGDVCWLLIISHTLINDEVPPWYALSRGVAGTVGAKVVLLSGTAKCFRRKDVLLLHFDQSRETFIGYSVG